MSVPLWSQGAETFFKTASFPPFVHELARTTELQDFPEMHALNQKQTKHMSLPWTYLQSRSTETTLTASRSDSLSEQSPAGQVLRKSEDFLLTTQTKSKRFSEVPSAVPGGLLHRLQRVWRRSASFVFPQNFSERHSRPSSRQRINAGDISSLLTHARRTTSTSLPATHSMTSTGNPTPSSFTHHTRGESTSTHSQKSSSNSSSSTASSYRIPLKIRDFTYQTPDPRHQGLGEDGRGTLNVPKENRVRVIYKMLLDDAGYQAWKQAAIGANREAPDSDETDADSDEDEDQEDEEDEEGWDGQWTMPSDDSTDPNYADEEEEDIGPLSPGLYRALYSFDPEGSREMALKEDQVVRVVGPGGGVGWAVVVVDGVDEKGNKRASQKDRQLALVPESYLEALTLDDDEE
ncbi:hypothetical protein BT96DRAFT_414837 [Gymnopus androsaceus JB14]|uniref:SH3 domain-containing protein n=1 Tax=Gymnopus androsaceus JB14 TaxID=1447944 RepID=A0A6A4GTJ5_9AGAR|nr:hypothetical protein BT96DRAFT_414837 [Gymnopus androsaceus JB14]